jgi:hypothetical protein
MRYFPEYRTVHCHRRDSLRSNINEHKIRTEQKQCRIFFISPPPAPR